MVNNSKLLVEICKDVVSELVEKGFLENNLSVKQLEKLREIKNNRDKIDS